MNNQIETYLSSNQALARLRAGNERYMTGAVENPNRSPAHRATLSEEQQPFAAILGCADSRVPPCLVFDQGLGDLFVIRVAGNIVDNSVLGSLEFAVVQLQVPLIVVLGHSGCGAVSATIEGKNLPGHLPHVAQAIQPAAACVRYHEGDLVDNTIRMNTHMVKNQLRHSEPILAPRVDAGQLKIVSAYYDLSSGQVIFFDNGDHSTNELLLDQLAVKMSL